MNQLKALFLFILLACSLNITAQRIKGSDTVLPVSQETAEIFMKDDPDRRVTVTGGGTGVGISALMDNTTDIAMASRPIKFSEKMKLKEAQMEANTSLTTAPLLYLQKCEILFLFLPYDSSFLIRPTGYLKIMHCPDQFF